MEILKFIPRESETLGMLHDSRFRPDQAPKSTPINKGRVLFEQGGQAIDEAKAVRVPLCLLSVGDTRELREICKTNKKLLGLDCLNIISKDSPTAAGLFDAYRQIKSNPTLVWFAEDKLFADTVSRISNFLPEIILPIFQDQADRTVELLERLVNKSDKNLVRRHLFSDKQVVEAISEAIHLEALRLGYTSRDKKKLGESSAVFVAVTHALFPLIESLLGNHGELSVVQGPVHLETNPPSWNNNQALKTVREFIIKSAADSMLKHRSLLPCLFNGEPIAEESVLDLNSPQLGRTQQWKLEKWLSQPVFPLINNPIFGHAIGLIDDPQVSNKIDQLITAEDQNNNELGMIINSDLAEIINKTLSVINFWI